MSKLKVGDRARVKRVHKIETFNDEMVKFIGQVGTIVLELPREWKDHFKTGRFRVDFDDKSLVYNASDGKQHHHVLNFFAQELELIP